MRKYQNLVTTCLEEKVATSGPPHYVGVHHGEVLCLGDGADEPLALDFDGGGHDDERVHSTRIGLGRPLLPAICLLVVDLQEKTKKQRIYTKYILYGKNNRKENKNKHLLLCTNREVASSDDVAFVEVLDPFGRSLDVQFSFLCVARRRLRKTSLASRKEREQGSFS